MYDDVTYKDDDVTYSYYYRHWRRRGKGSWMYDDVTYKDDDVTYSLLLQTLAQKRQGKLDRA